MSLRILHISSATTWRGGEQQIAYLANALADNGVSSFILTPSGSEMSKKDWQSKIKTITYIKGFSWNPLVGHLIKKVCSRHKIDLIHIHDSHAHTYTWLAYEFWNLRIPAVLSRRVDFAISSTSQRKYNHPGIKKILCVSSYIADIVKLAVKDHQKIVTVYSGIDLQKIHHTDKMEVYQQYQIPDDRIIVGNIAALADHKNQITLLKAAKVFLEKYSKQLVHFIIVGGDGGEEQTLKSYVYSQDLSSHVTFTGYVNNPIAHLKAFDIFLFTSKMEGLGTSVLDAMACQIPIISTQSGGLQELINDQVTACSIPPFDAEKIAEALYSLIQDPTKQKKIVSGATDLVADFSKEVTAQKTLDIYRQILNS